MKQPQKLPKRGSMYGASLPAPRTHGVMSLLCGMMFAVLFFLAVSSAGTAEAKSLYVIADIFATPTPIKAYDIQGTALVLQAIHGVQPLGEGAAGLAIDTDSKTLFVTYWGSNIIQLLNATDFSDLGSTTAPQATNLAGIVVDQRKSKVYAVELGTNHLYVYSWDPDAKTLTLDGADFIALPRVTSAHGLALDEVRSRLYVSDVTTTVRHFDTTTWLETGNFNVSQPAIGIAVDVLRGFVYTGNPHSVSGSLNLLSKFDLNTNQETSHYLGSGISAFGVAVDQPTGLVYITTGGQGTTGAGEVQVFTSRLRRVFSTGAIGDPGGLCVPGVDISYNPLNLTKSDGLGNDGCVVPGGEIQYSICFDNLKNSFIARNVTVVDNLPTGTEFVSATGNYTVAGSRVIWSLGNLPAGASQRCVQLRVRVPPTVTRRRILRNICSINSLRTARTTTSVETRVCERLVHRYAGDVDSDGKIDVEDYHLMAVSGVVEPFEPDAAAVFGGALLSSVPGESPEYDIKRLRIFQYDASSSNSYVEYPNVNPVRAGEGYWVVSTVNRRIIVQGTPLLENSSFPVSLQPGWNLVGFPFLAQSAWGDAKVRVGTDEFSIGSTQNVWVEHTAWGYDRGYSGVDTVSGLLQPWNAYWMRNIGEASVEILIPPPSATASLIPESALLEPNTLAASASSRTGIAFSLNEHCCAYLDRTLFLGLDSNALVGPDPLDCLAPPALSSRVPRIWVDHRDWNKRPGLYAVDIRPRGRYPAKFGLTMRVPKKPKVTKYVLSWNGLNSIPSGLKATLVDRVKGRSLNMRQVPAYEIAVPPNKVSYGLQVVIQ